MSTVAASIDTYMQEPGGFRLRSVVAAGVVLTHVAAIGYLFMAKPEPELAEAGAMQVVFIAPPQPEESTPPPPQPKIEQPPILAAKRQAEPAPDAPVVPPEPTPDAPVTEAVKEMAPPAPPPSAVVSSPVAADVGDDAVAVIYVPVRRDKFRLPAGVPSVTVRLKVLVNVRGRPENIQLAVSSGNPAADRRAMEDVRDYKFRPAKVAGVPVSKEVTLPVKYDAR